MTSMGHHGLIQGRTRGVRHSPVRNLASLRRFVQRLPAPERCELCAANVPAEHQHLVDPGERRLLCACDACAILFDENGVTQYRRVPRDVRAMDGEIDELHWNGLGIPVNLAFFLRSSVSGDTVAVYPSPAGATESSIAETAWRDLAALHPALDTIRPDVEALLVNRSNGAHDCLIVPVDRCYQLVGLIRLRWQGLSGGDQAWQAIHSFFDELKERAIPERSARA